jgi:pentatricopeptide repeat protein
MDAGVWYVVLGCCAGSLMNAFVRAGLWERALDVMATAKEKRIRLNEGSYTAGLMACEKVRGMLSSSPSS